MKKEEKELILNKAKSDSRVLMNVTLLGICFTIFTFIITINPELLDKNIFLTLQLVCAIPLMMTALFARSKLGYITNANRWDVFGFITFLLGYTFLVNVVGMLLIFFISFKVGLIFLLVNILLAISYSIMDISYDKEKIKGRIIKDLIFILLIVFLAILPSLGVY